MEHLPVLFWLSSRQWAGKKRGRAFSILHHSLGGPGPGRLQRGGSRARGPCGILTSLQQFVLKTLLCQGGTGARLRLCPTVNTRLEGLSHWPVNTWRGAAAAKKTVILSMERHGLHCSTGP